MSFNFELRFENAHSLSIFKLQLPIADKMSFDVLIIFISIEIFQVAVRLER